MEIHKTEEKVVNIINLQENPVRLDQDFTLSTDGEFKTDCIDFPEHLRESFLRSKILPGFTKGALKNVLYYSSTMVRLYEVTVNKISLLFRAEIESEELQNFFDQGEFREQISKIMVDQTKQESTIELILVGRENNSKGLNFKFCFKTGDLLDAQIHEIDNLVGIEKLIPIEIDEEKRKKSEFLLKNLYFYGTESEEFEADFHTKHLIFRSKETTSSVQWPKQLVFKKWLDLENLIYSSIAAEKKLYPQQVNNLSLEIREKCRLEWGNYLRASVNPFLRTRAKLTLLIIESSSHIFFFLFDLRRRKMLKQSSLSLLDLLDEDQIAKILENDSLWKRESEEAEEMEDLNETIRFDLMKEVYLEDSKSTILSLGLNGVSTRIKIEDIFNKKQPACPKVTEKSKFWPNNFSKNQFVKLFGNGPRILVRCAPRDPDSLLSPLGWLDPNTLEEEKLKGFEESELYARMNNIEEDKMNLTQRLTDNRLLIISPYFACIFDFEEGELIASLSVDAEEMTGADLPELYDIIAEPSLRSVRLKRVGRLKDGRIVHHMTKTHYLKEYFNLCEIQPGYAKQKLFRLSSGNYLYLTAQCSHEYHEERKENRTGYLVSLEIDPNSLEVLKVRKKRENGFISDLFSDEEVYQISDFFIFSAELRSHAKELLPPLKASESGVFELRNKSRLILSTLDFEILDFFKTTQLWKNGIKSISLR